MTELAQDLDIEDELYSIADAARYLGRPRRFIERHMARGDLEPQQLVGGHRIFRRSELDAFGEAHPGQVRHPHPTALRGWCRPDGVRAEES